MPLSPLGRFAAARKRGAGQAVYAVMQKRSINLTFHGIGEPPRALDPGEENVWVAHDRFVALLDSVAGREDVRITFDDGNASDVEQALPALVDRELDATFFVVAGRLGEPTFLDATGVRELAAAGMGIGCHGMRHRPVAGPRRDRAARGARRGQGDTRADRGAPGGASGVPVRLL